MVLPGDSVEDIIAHYASANYDPAKAHEYYLKTRDLKGRRSTKGFSENQRKGWDYVKSQVQAKKKTKIDAARGTKKTSIEQVRGQARALRADISERLKAFNKKLSENYSEESKDITEDSQQKRVAIAKKLAADILAVPEVPKNLPKDQRERLLAERAEKIQKLRGEANAARADLNDDVQDERVSERTAVKKTRESNNAAVSAKRAQVAGELKQVVQKYIAAYNSAKAQIQSESEATLDKEHKNIKSKVR